MSKNTFVAGVIFNLGKTLCQDSLVDARKVVPHLMFQAVSFWYMHCITGFLCNIKSCMCIKYLTNYFQQKELRMSYFEAVKKKRQKVLTTMPRIKSFLTEKVWPWNFLTFFRYSEFKFPWYVINKDLINFPSLYFWGPSIGHQFLYFQNANKYHICYKW